MKKKTDIIRSSVAEYLTSVTATGENQVEAIYADENVWLSQKMMGILYDVDVRTINYHLLKIFSDQELEENSVIQNFRITAQDGKNYEVAFYSLDMILAIGFRVRSKRGTEFRQWADRNLKEYMIKGFVMDDDRLKKCEPHGQFVSINKCQRWLTARIKCSMR